MRRNHDQALRPSHTVETGPLLDSHQCGASGCSSDTHSNSSLVRTDNFNKVQQPPHSHPFPHNFPHTSPHAHAQRELQVLAVDRRDDKLLVCGSVKQGSCTKFHLSDISSAPEAVVEAVAANTEVCVPTLIITLANPIIITLCLLSRRDPLSRSLAHSSTTPGQTGNH